MRNGVIFLENSKKESPCLSPSAQRYRLFQSNPQVVQELRLRKSCEKANNRFHDIHAQYARKNLEEAYILIMLRGELSLWKKENEGNYHEVKSQPTEAKGLAYNYLKTLLHISTALFMLADMNARSKLSFEDTQSHLSGMVSELTDITSWESELTRMFWFLEKNFQHCY
ncbi:hypothetical protein [Legionella brunensis]|uniref:Uncharacterized protein n=1 Tax=Legionella brunensis TaxID=29422 RepID=A0A0W0SSX7_9GAMM|nr:hypothetical protein [Legionella brunensis]KTC86475.1 hypothetical protein Lbru_0416 [Legionella brunensis]